MDSIIKSKILIEKNDSAKTIWRILEIADLLKKYGEYICSQEGITTQQWLLLLHLAGDPNIPYFEREKHFKPLMASELAEGLNVSRPNVTNLLNSLLKKELIEQVEDDIDRRKKRLKLSAKGVDLVKKLEPGRKTFNDNLFSGFKQKEKKNLLKYLSQIDHALIEHFTENMFK